MKVLNDILKFVQPIEIIGRDDIKISSIVFDSRKVEKGCLFVATRGTKVDGHDFIDLSVANSTVAVVCEQQINR